MKLNLEISRIFTIHQDAQLLEILGIPWNLAIYLNLMSVFTKCEVISG
jgi:hypothetical protein